MPSQAKNQKNSSVEKYHEIFALYPQVKLVYLFGSRVNGKIGPLSDYDFAVYLDEKNPKAIFELKLKIMTSLSKLLKTDAVDLVILDSAESPELKYNIIQDGSLIYEQEPFKLLVEPKILNEYFDFNFMLLRNNLTKNYE